MGWHRGIQRGYERAHLRRARLDADPDAETLERSRAHGTDRGDQGCVEGGCDCDFDCNLPFVVVTGTVMILSGFSDLGGR